MWTEVAEEKERIREDIESLNGDCQTLDMIKKDLDKRDRKLLRDQEKLEKMRD